MVSALHHSRDAGQAKDEALRGQMTTTEGGKRPGVLKEPAPQLVVAALAHRAVEGPSLVEAAMVTTPLSLPSLSGAPLRTGGKRKT